MSRDKCEICGKDFADCEDWGDVWVGWSYKTMCDVCKAKRDKEIQDNGGVQCVSCEAWLDYDDGICVPDGVLCYPCYESDVEYASTLLHYHQEGKEIVKIGDYIREDIENCEDAEWVDDILEKRKWHRTYGWGGFYDTKLKEGYVELTNGWATGRYSDVGWKHLVNDLGDWLPEHGQDAPGEGLYILIEPTSNIFSLATTIFCAEKDAEAIKAWLAENGFEVEALERALS